MTIRDRSPRRRTWAVFRLLLMMNLLACSYSPSSNNNIGSSIRDWPASSSSSFFFFFFFSSFALGLTTVTTTTRRRLQHHHSSPPYSSTGGFSIIRSTSTISLWVAKNNNNPSVGDDQDNKSSPAASSSSKNSAAGAGGGSLGINLGRDYSLALNETDREALQLECRQMIDQRISEGILDLQRLHDKWERDVKDGLLPLEQAMTLNGIRESKQFAIRVDSMFGKFWNQTAKSRQKTHDLFHIDELEQKQKAKEEEERQAKRGKRKGGSSSSSSSCSTGTTTFRPQSWKKTNDAWDEWDSDDW